MTRNILKFLLLIVMMISFRAGAAAAAPAWSVNPHDFQYDMSLYGNFTLGGESINCDGYIIAAFAGDECRGVGENFKADGMTSPVVYMRIYSNGSEAITFKAYDKTTDIVRESAGSIEFTADKLLGYPSDPQQVKMLLPATGVTLNETDKTLIIGDTFSLSYTLTPTNADATVTWSSSNTAVATVDANGKVTAVAKGSADISATADNGVKATCSVTVNPPALTAITLSESTKTLFIGDSFSLTYTLTPANAEATITWSSSNTAVATVDANGKVTAVAKGSADITATSNNGVTATCKVTVNPPALTAITLSETTKTLVIGDSFQLSCTLTPSNAEPTITWSSSNTAVATVDANGKVTAVAKGTADITATSDNGISTTCKVTVNPPVLTAISLSATTRNLTEGDSFTLTYTLTPATAEATITWSSSNTAVATVDDNGKVTAVAVGTADITATSDNGVSATCKVTVNNIVLTAITLSETAKTLTIGDYFSLSYTLTPSNAEATVTWSSSNTAVATVDTNGKVTAVAKGSADITATADNGVKATCKVTVNPPALTAITLSETVKTLTIGDSFSLTYTLTPSNTEATITWSSSNTAVATVDTNGKVTAVAKGSADITAKADNGLTATCKVTVEKKVILVTEIILDPKEKEAEEGTTFTITATVYPEDATDISLKWESSDPEVATVENGVVTVLKSGITVITVTALDGSGVYAQCSLSSYSGIKEILSENGRCDIYNLSGCLILKDADANDIRNLNKGIYILRTGNKTLKIIL